MASKGKGKLKKYEVLHEGKPIDLRRFAYDVIKYTALRFRVPENCIAVWDGPANDYGPDDFFLVVSRKITQSQLAERYRYNMYFREHYERNKLATVAQVGRVLQEVINKEMVRFQMPDLVKVGISLAVVCELFLFLYSEDINLCPKKLSTTWFECYLNINKKKFENAGGLKQMYSNGKTKKIGDIDEFVDKFIGDYCLPYKTTASIPEITELFIRLFQMRLSESAKPLSEGKTEDIEEAVKSVTEMLQRQHLDVEFEEVIVVPLPEADEACGTNVPQNTDFGNIPQDKLLQLVGPLVTSPHDPSAASPKGKPRRGRIPYKPRMKTEMEDSGDELLQNPGLGVPLPHEMYDFPFPVDTAQSQKLPEESVQELSPHTKGSSHLKRSKKQSPRASVEQGLEQPISDSSEMKRPIVTRTVASPKSPSGSSPKEHGTLSYKQRMKMMKSGFRTNVEQGLGQPSLDTSEKKEPIVSRTVTSPKSPSASSTNEHGTLSYKQRMKMMNSGFRTNVEQGLLQPSLDTSEKKEPIISRTVTSLKSPSVSSPKEHRTLSYKQRMKKEIGDSEEESLQNPGLGVPLPHEMYDFAFPVDTAQSMEHGTLSYKERMKSSLLAQARQRILDEYVAIQLGRYKLNVHRSRVPSLDSSEKSLKELPRRPRSLTHEELLKILSTSDYESPLTSKREETSLMDLPSNPGLGEPLPRKIYDFLLPDNSELSENLTEESVQELSKHAISSHRERRNGKPSLRASVDQGLERSSSDSLEAEKPIVTWTVASPKDSSATNPEEQPRCSRIGDEEMAILRICEESLTSKRGETLEVDLPSNHGLGVPLPHEIYNFPFFVDAAQSQKLPNESVQELTTPTKGSSHLKRSKKQSPRVSVEQGLEQPSSDSSETKKAIVTRTVTSPKSPSALSPKEQPNHHGTLSYQQRREMIKSGLRTSMEQGLGQPSLDTSEKKEIIVTRTVTSPKSPSASSPKEHGTLSYDQRVKMIKSSLRASVEQLSSDAYEMIESSRKTTSFTRTLVPSLDPSATNSEDKLRRPRTFTNEEPLKTLSISDDESPLTSKREETSGVDLSTNPGLGVPIAHEMHDFLLPDVAELSKNLTEQSGQELSKYAISSHREGRNGKPSLRACVDKGLEWSSSDSLYAKKPIVTRTVASPKDSTATNTEAQLQRSRIGDDAIAKILSICEEYLTAKRGETLEVDLPSNLGLGIPLPHEIYNFPLSVDTAQSQKRPEENVQELSKRTKGSSHRERSRKPSPHASEEQGLEQPSSDSSETKKPFVSRTIASSKGPSASSPEEQPQHQGTLSCKQRMKIIESGLRASVEQDLVQPSSDSYGMKLSGKKTPIFPSILVPSQDSSATNPKQHQRPRNLTNEQITKILRNLSDEEIARLLSISEEESTLTSQRDESSKVDLPLNPGLGAPFPQEMYDFPLVDVTELSQYLSEEYVQETPKHAILSHRERIDGKPSLRASVEQGFEQPSSDSPETKNPIVTRTVASPKSPSASCPEEQPQHYRTLSYEQGMERIESGFRASVEQDLGQPSSDSPIATDTTQSYERLGAKPKIQVENTGSSGLQKTKSREKRKRKIQEE